jgi:hypothetical protein
VGSTPTLSPLKEETVRTEVEGKYDTPYGYMELEPGPDLDALIAEHIMGWSQIAEWGIGAIHRGHSPTELAGRPPWTRITEAVPPYSSELQSAYVALQHLIETQKINVVIERDFFNDWAVRIEASHESPSAGDGRAWHRDLGTAICGALVSWIKARQSV